MSYEQDRILLVMLRKKLFFFNENISLIASVFGFGDLKILEHYAFALLSFSLYSNPKW